MNKDHIEPSRRGDDAVNPVSPNRFNAEIARKILKSIGNGIPRLDAAAEHDVDPHTFAAWIDRHPDFIGQIRKAEGQDIGRTLARLRKAGPWWRAHAWALERRYPDRYARTIPTLKAGPPAKADPGAPTEQPVPMSVWINQPGYGYDPKKGMDKEMCDRWALAWQIGEQQREKERIEKGLPPPEPQDPFQ